MVINRDRYNQFATLPAVEFKDYFSDQAKEYSASRPSYPKELFEFLSGLVAVRNVAWDCATGNGQAALSLSQYFNIVIASDASMRQIEHAQTMENIHYAVFSAEQAALKENSIDLLTVAQALHWFQFDSFYREAQRVLKRGAVIAVWTYGLYSISPVLDKITHTLYEDILGRYWPPERKFVENEYRDVPFPYREMPCPRFQLQTRWTLQDAVKYLYTWSSTQRYLKSSQGQDPVKEIFPQLKEAWDAEGKSMVVTWPIYIKAGRRE